MINIVIMTFGRRR